MANAPVFPDPVSASPMTSFPFRKREEHVNEYMGSVHQTPTLAVIDGEAIEAKAVQKPCKYLVNMTLLSICHMGEVKTTPTLALRNATSREGMQTYSDHVSVNRALRDSRLRHIVVV